MADAPELYQKVKQGIEDALKADNKIASISKKVAKGTATHADTQAYALRLGKISSDALLRYLTANNLPDEDLYYNIAKKAVGQTLRDNLKRVNDVGMPIQTSLNNAAGLGLNSVGAKLNKDRIDGLVSAIDNCAELDHARELLEEPIINTTQSFADDLIKENADMQYEAGLNPTITRTAEAGCCEWCAALAGTYSYPLPEDTEVYKRHEYCRCVVEYNPKDGRGIQNSHTKQWKTDPETIAARKAYGL